MLSEKTNKTLFGVLKLSMPILIILGLQRLLNFVDLYILGLSSETEMASVSQYIPIAFVMLSFATGIGVTSTVIFSRIFGSKNYQRILNTFSNLIIASIIFCLVVLTLGLAGYHWIENGLHVDDTYKSDFKSYFSIIFIGQAALLAFSPVAGFLRGFGKINCIIFSGIVTTVINVVLTYYLVIVQGMGLEGAAFATLLSMVLDIIIQLYFTTKVYRKEMLKFVGSRLPIWGINYEVRGILIALGVPTILSFLILSINIGILQSFFSQLGTQELIAFAFGFRIEVLLLLPALALGEGMLITLGHSYGENDVKHFWYTAKVVLLLIIGIYLLQFSAVWYLMSTQTISSGLASAESIAMMKKYLLFISFSQIAISIAIFTESVLGALHSGIKILCSYLAKAALVFIAFVYLRESGDFSFQSLVHAYAAVNLASAFMILFLRSYRSKSLRDGVFYAPR